MEQHAFSLKFFCGSGCRLQLTLQLVDHFVKLAVLSVQTMDDFLTSLELFIGYFQLVEGRKKMETRQANDIDDFELICALNKLLNFQLSF